MSMEGGAAPLTVVGASQVSLGVGGRPSGGGWDSIEGVGVVAPPLPVVARSSKVSMKGGTAMGSATADGIRHVDAARCEVYVCYEGPLGTYLKAEVRERIWKGEYVKIF